MQWFDSLVLDPVILKNIITTLAAIIIIWLIRAALLRVASRRFDDIAAHYQWRKISSYIAVALILAIVGPTWLGGIGSTATYFGLLSAGLAIALQPLIVDFIGWIFILWRRPFRVGDRIQIGEHAGDVVDLRLFQFVLLEIGNWVEADQNTGRLIHIPNGQVFSEALANYSRGFEYLWHELPVLVTFESDWQKAKQILETIAERHGVQNSELVQRRVAAASRRLLIVTPNLEPEVYLSVEDSGVLLTLRYLCAVRERRDSAEAIWIDILKAFAKNDDIDFAYPTQRLYYNPLEGKEGTRPFADGVMLEERRPARNNQEQSR